MLKTYLKIFFRQR